MSSIQFRSRIKPAINYAPKLNDFGICCDQDGNYTSKTFIECFNENGQFVAVSQEQINAGATPCPNIDTRRGCCCSCSYVTPTELSNVPNYPTTTPYLNSGLRPNVSKCECERIGGKWTEGECPASLTTANWEGLCVRDGFDARTPRKCCHLGFDETTGWPTEITCTEVCTSGDCADLSTDAYPSIFGDIGERCTDSLSCTNPLNRSIFSTSSSLYEDFEIGSCYTLEDNNGTLEYNCTLSPQSLCQGYWVVEQDQEQPYCTSSYQPSNPTKIDGVYQPQTMTLADFNALGLSAGDEFQGGVYIGIYKPSTLSGKSSEVYGNLSFNDPKFHRFVADNIGGSDTQWAIIVDETSYPVPFYLENEKIIDYKTSLWDGYYNTYGNNDSFFGIQNALTNTIRNNIRKGFIDFYLPSIYELYFYSAYLYNKGLTTRGNMLSSSMFSTKYLNSSSSKTKLYNDTFVYTQIVNSKLSVNFKTALTNVKNIEMAYFFRRIVLT